jgi:signal transduction histidine kinase
MFRSLRLKLAASHAAVLLVILLVLGSSGQYLIARRLDAGATRELVDAAHAGAEQLDESSPAQPADSDTPSAAAVKLAVFDAAGQLVGDGAEAPPWLVPQKTLVTDVLVAGEAVRLVTVRIERNGATVATIVAGRSLAPEEALLHHVRILMLLGSILAILFSLIAGWWLAGVAVEPVIRSYEAQASFAADASHELRTPLAFIRSGVEVLAEDEPDLGGQVLDEIDYLTSLADRLLVLARAEREGLGLQLSAIDVKEACLSAAGRSKIAHGNRVDAPGGPELAAIGDRAATEAAMDAVFENVRTHGGGTAGIDWRAHDGRAIITIADHGPGLPGGVARERAFERFFRADRSRARATGGTGLGLSLARTLVEAQGGSMWLEETPGGGLTAKIALALRV